MNNQAREAGKRAAHRGMSIRSNPFMSGTLFYMQWKDAFLECVTEEQLKKKTPLVFTLKKLKKKIQLLKGSLIF